MWGASWSSRLNLGLASHAEGFEPRPDSCERPESAIARILESTTPGLSTDGVDVPDVFTNRVAFVLARLRLRWNTTYQRDPILHGLSDDQALRTSLRIEQHYLDGPSHGGLRVENGFYLSC